MNLLSKILTSSRTISEVNAWGYGFFGMKVLNPVEGLNPNFRITGWGFSFKYWRISFWVERWDGPNLLGSKKFYIW